MIIISGAKTIFQQGTQYIFDIQYFINLVRLVDWIFVTNLVPLFYENIYTNVSNWLSKASISCIFH